MWLPFALFSALISGGRRIYDKHLTNIFGNYAMGFVVQAFSLLPHLILIFLIPGGTEVGDLPWRFWWPLIIIWGVLYPVQTYLMYRAIRESDISTVTPVMCLLPVFNVGTSFVLLGEVPSIIGMIGILLIVLGTYMMLRKKNAETKISMPVLLMIGAMFCIAIGSSLDKVSIQVSNPVFYAFMNTLGASIVFLVMIHFYKERESFKHMGYKFWVLTFMGLLQALSFTASMYAFKYGPVSYVLAIRAGSYVLAGLYGVMVLKEDFSSRKKIAFICFLLGVLSLAFA
jgi:uncharacterized membrane protein